VFTEHYLQATTSFIVDNHGGSIVVTESLDYEVSTNYTLAVMASDSPTDSPCLAGDVDSLAVMYTVPSVSICQVEKLGLTVHALSHTLR